jgi:hypothetical protein
MRTTLSLDDDVLIAARAIAQQQHRSIGEVVSNLARRALHRPQSSMRRNGIPLLPPMAHSGTCRPNPSSSANASE